jgi:hypothetical protein
MAALPAQKKTGTCGAGLLLQMEDRHPACRLG